MINQLSSIRSIRSQCLMTIAFALVVSLNLFLILELDRPFSGLAQISPTPLEQELARITSGQTE